MNTLTITKHETRLCLLKEKCMTKVGPYNVIFVYNFTDKEEQNLTFVTSAARDLILLLLDFSLKHNDVSDYIFTVKLEMLEKIYPEVTISAKKMTEEENNEANMKAYGKILTGG